MIRIVSYRLLFAWFWLASSLLRTAMGQSAWAGQRLNAHAEPPFHLRDPYIFADSKKYFLFGTASPTQGFQCYESTDLEHWKSDGWAWHMSALRVARGNLAAPQVFLYNGMYCLVYSARTALGTTLGLAASVQPQGPYHDLHVPWLGLGDGCTIGSVFVDDNGKAYLTFSKEDFRNGASIYGLALNEDLSKATGFPVRLLKPDQRWELSEKNGRRSLEAARIFKIGSKYYLTYSAVEPRTSESAIGYATADKPLGPWSKSSENPLLSTRPEPGGAQPGQGAVFRSLDRNEWFFVYQTFAAPTQAYGAYAINIDQLVLQGIRQLAIKTSRRPVGTPGLAR